MSFAPDLEKKFVQHLERLQGFVADYCKVGDADSLVIPSGAHGFFWEDDQDLPFRTNHHFNWWCPDPEPQRWLVLRPTEKPQLIALHQDSYWVQSVDPSAAWWVPHFDFHVFSSLKEVSGSLPESRAIYLGPEDALARDKQWMLNPKNILAMLAWDRSFKDDYEVACIELANAHAAKGHRAAKDAFATGGSEYDIHLAYLAGLSVTEDELPYPTICGVNENGAVLHYHGKQRKPVPARAFLIDAGARYNGYASDITRTYLGSDGDSDFGQLIAGMEKSQQEICAELKPGVMWADLHLKALLGVARCLTDVGVIRDIDEQGAVELGLAEAFLPHGLGHLLGLHTHDTGGQQCDREGSPCPGAGQYKYLRSYRELDAGMVMTVEPGLYFIPQLLDQLSNKAKGYLHQPTVDRLLPHGGIRIEDDVLVTTGAPKNLTRAHLPH